MMKNKRLINVFLKSYLEGYLSFKYFPDKKISWLVNKSYESIENITNYLVRLSKIPIMFDGAETIKPGSLLKVKNSKGVRLTSVQNDIFDTKNISKNHVVLVTSKILYFQILDVGKPNLESNFPAQNGLVLDFLKTENKFKIKNLFNDYLFIVLRNSYFCVSINNEQYMVFLDQLTNFERIK